MFNSLKILLMVAAFALAASCNLTKGKPSVGERRGAFAGSSNGQLQDGGIFSPNYQLFPDDPARSQQFNDRFPIFHNSSVARIEPGNDFFASRMQLLEAATKSVRVQYLLFHGDESGYAIADKLIALHRKGIKVDVIIDNISNITINEQKLYYYMQRNGLNVNGYEFLYFNIAEQLARATDFGIVTEEANHRYHDKIFAIDAEIPEKAAAIIGGSNIGNNYYRVNPSNYDDMWTDSDVIVKGDVVGKIAQIFDENLADFQADSGIGGTISDFLWKAANGVLGDPSPPELNINIQATLTNLVTKPISYQWDQVPMRFVQSRPRKGEDYIHPIYIDLIESAQSEILISNAYFVPETPFINALKDASRRGVKVTIMTNSKEIIDVPQVTVIGRAQYAEILEVNTETGNENLSIYEWGGHPNLNNGESQNHSKFMVVDGHTVIVGSYNIDSRSQFLNSETVMVYQSANNAAEFRNAFNGWLSPQLTTKITKSDADQYVAPSGLREKFDLLISQAIKPFL